MSRFFPRRKVSLSLGAFVVAGWVGWLSGPSMAFAQDVRTWTDSTGKFRIQAKFSGVDDNKVTLVQTNGEEIEIPLDKLSRADQDFIKNLPKDNPFQPKSSNPFAPKPATGASGPAGSMPASVQPANNSGGVVDDSGSYETRLVRSFGLANQVPLINQGDGWTVKVEDLLGTAPQNYAGKPISLAPKTDFFEKITNLLLSPSGTHAVISYKLEHPRGEKHTRLVVADLKTAKVIADRKTGGVLSALALSDDAKTVVMRRDEFGFGNSDRLELWTVNSNNIQKGDAWIPYDDARSGSRDVQWADFTADGKLLTVSSTGRIMAWTLNPLKLEWACETVGGCRPALSPARKHLLLATNNQICLLDLMESRVTASISVEPGTNPRMSFSPEGTRFALVSGAGGQVFETATGAPFRTVESTLVPSLGSSAGALFLSEDQVLFDNQYLLDLPSLIPLWHYQDANATFGLGSSTWFVSNPNDRSAGVLFGARLPHPAVNEALKKAIADPNYFVVKPGSTVRLNLDALPDEQKRTQVREAMTKKLAEKDIQVGSEAAVEIVCRFDPPKDQNIIFRGFGGMEAVDFKETVAHIAISYNGQQLWHTSASNRPWSVSMERGESLQDAVKKREAPNYQFFSGANLPRMLVDPSKGGGRMLGASKVTTTGIH